MSDDRMTHESVEQTVSRARAELAAELSFERAMHRFSSVSGIPFADLIAMRPDDAADLLRLWSAARRLAEMDRTLSAELVRVSAPKRFTRHSTAVAITLLSLTALAFLILCTGIWRFLA